jgi:hypothetical protein
MSLMTEAEALGEGKQAVRPADTRRNAILLATCSPSKIIHLIQLRQTVGASHSGLTRSC